MEKLSVTNASRMAGVSRQTIYQQIKSGELSRTPEGIELNELLRVYPGISAQYTAASHGAYEPKTATVEKTQQQAGTVELLVRELEWNKELLEQTNLLMAKQLADQRALIADQARRLDEKDRFWARQIEIAQSLLPAPAPIPVPRKKILGIF